MSTLSKRKIIFEYLPMAITALTILISAIILKQMVIKVFPVLFSIVIALLSSKANRLYFLLGAANSVIYIIGYIMEGLYGTMLSTLFGIVMMLIAFFQWKKNSYGKATIIRKFTTKQRILLVCGLIIAWGIATLVLGKIGGSVSVIDGLVLILGFVVPVLNIWAYIESPALNCICLLMQIPMWVIIIFSDSKLENITYLISTIYTFYMMVRTFIKWYVLYKEQHAKIKSKENAQI